MRKLLPLAVLALSACSNQPLTQNSYDDYYFGCVNRDKSPGAEVCKQEAAQACDLNGCDGKIKQWD